METYIKNLTPPVNGDKWFSDKKYNPEAGGKYDMFEKHDGHLGNCTQYSYGIFSKQHNKKFGIPFTQVVCKDGKNWYDNAPKEYKRGKEPRLGAIIVLAHTTKRNGHVGNVEELYPNGDILVSMSGYASYLFKLKTLTKKNGYVYSDYKLLGFIYPNIEYKKPTTYVVESPRYVRKGAGTEFDIKKVKELTKDGQKNCVNTKPEDKAQYKKGTKFTVKKMIKAKNGSYWAETPSGYVCIQSSKGKMYCHTK